MAEVDSSTAAWAQLGCREASQLLSSGARPYLDVRYSCPSLPPAPGKAAPALCQASLTPPTHPPPPARPSTGPISNSLTHPPTRTPPQDGGGVPGGTPARCCTRALCVPGPRRQQVAQPRLHPAGEAQQGARSAGWGCGCADFSTALKLMKARLRAGFSHFWPFRAAGGAAVPRPGGASHSGVQVWPPLRRGLRRAGRPGLQPAGKPGGGL